MPLSISIPPFWDGVPDSLLLRTIILSLIVTVSELTVVVVPDTVKLPVTATLPANPMVSPASVPIVMVWSAAPPAYSSAASLVNKLAFVTSESVLLVNVKADCI